ncbi:hypothetical protein D1872_287670 [compost metagenome]
MLANPRVQLFGCFGRCRYFCTVIGKDNRRSTVWNGLIVDLLEIRFIHILQIWNLGGVYRFPQFLAYPFGDVIQTAFVQVDIGIGLSTFLGCNQTI